MVRQSRKRRRAWLLAAAALLLGAAGARAQIRVEGEVIDGVTGMPVRGVIIQFPDLGIATLSDSLGYFSFDAVPRGSQLLTTYHMAYDDLEGEAPVTPGDVLVLKLTPRAIPLEGVDVEVRTRGEVEGLTLGRMTDYIGREAVEEMAERTNKVLEVMRAKAPPRLRIQQQGGVGGIEFCIMNTRMRPSVQELKDLGIGCKPVMLILDGTVVYAPPSDGRFASMEARNLPQDVAYMLLNQNPDEIESIRVLSSSEAFFRYGEDGRLGAVEIVTRHPARRRR